MLWNAGCNGEQIIEVNLELPCPECGGQITRIRSVMSVVELVYVNCPNKCVLNYRAFNAYAEAYINTLNAFDVEGIL